MPTEMFLNGKVGLCCGDSLHFLRDQPDNRYDSIVSDPPYALVSISKRFGSDGAAPVRVPKDGTGAYARVSAGFMGKKWDTGETAFAAEFWQECLRVLKPGGHVVAFGGTRTYHRLACAIEDAGFEIRDSLMWIYGVGFPKSHNISGHDAFCQCETKSTSECDVRSMQCADISEKISTRQTSGQVLQPSMSERSSQSIRSEQSEGIAGSKESSMERRCDIPSPPGQLRTGKVRSLPAGLENDGAIRRLRDGTPSSSGSTDWSNVDTDGMRASLGPQAIAQRGNEPRIVAGQSVAQDGGAWENCGRCGKPMVPEGLGTALKPAFEPIVLARKPLSEPTVAANVLRWGTGAINVDGCRVAAPDGVPVFSNKGEKSSTGYGTLHGSNRTGEINASTGRWPANVVHDGSEEMLAAFPDAPGQQHGNFPARHATEPRGDSGSAARFFYTAKADADDRLGSKHPTVKPVDLMQWLVRLVTPKGGLVLDPFAGTGTTAEACFREGMSCMLVERETEYQADIRRRMALALGGPEERRRESIKVKTKDQPIDAGPLFDTMR